MSDLTQLPPIKMQEAHVAELGSKLAFSRKLQAVANKIHATRDIDDIMLEIGTDICALLEADRVTLYCVSDDAGAIISKVKTGLIGFKDISLRAARGAGRDHAICSLIISLASVKCLCLVELLAGSRTLWA